MKRIAFYGGSFDPVHRGHIAVAQALRDQFSLDEFVFIPAFHAPHKVRLVPTSAYDRYAMLCLVTGNDPNVRVSKMEIEIPEHPFSVETLERLNVIFPDDETFFVMGADSWMDIQTWREWERVLSMSNHIVVTRRGVEMGVSHVTADIRSRIIDLRAGLGTVTQPSGSAERGKKIYLTDAVNLDVSATTIRRMIREGDVTWCEHVPAEVANYIEKYQIYR